MTKTAWQLAVVGAGPVGLALALQAARLLPHARVTLYDARAAAVDASAAALDADGRTLALSLGSVRWLQQLGVWPARGLGEAIGEVHVSQSAPSLLRLPGRSSADGAGAAIADGAAAPDLTAATEGTTAAGRSRPAAAAAAAAPAVWLRAAELGVPQLGAVVGYRELTAVLQRAWDDAAAAAPQRLHGRFGTPVAALKALADGVEVDAGIAERVDLAVLAEGGVASASAAVESVGGRARAVLTHDYAQTAWVGTAVLDGTAVRGRAVERFTPQGPLALLPLPPRDDGALRATLVWCVARDGGDAPASLDDAQRIALLNARLPPEAGRVVALSPLKPFALALAAERTLVRGRQVRIGNAAQTLHPVAGQGLNLGLRDAHALVAALRFADDLDAALARVEWARAADRWSLIAATDLLGRAFTWDFPGAAAARGLALSVLQAAPPLKALLARRLMFGWR